MEDSGKLRFYELDHESKMRLLKTHSHTSNGLALEPGTREEKQLKKTQTLQQGRSHPGLWWDRIKLRLYEGEQIEYSPRTCSIGRPAGGTLCPHLQSYTYHTYDRAVWWKLQ